MPATSTSTARPAVSRPVTFKTLPPVSRATVLDLLSGRVGVTGSVA